MPETLHASAPPDPEAASTALVDAFVAELSRHQQAGIAAASAHLGHQLARLTAECAVALLDGAATPPVDADELARALVAADATADDVAQSGVILFGLVVSHLAATRQDRADAIPAAVNQAILAWLIPTVVVLSALAPAGDPATAVPTDGDVPSLTARERDVLVALAAGADSPSICAALTISPHTLRHHITRLCDKLEAHNRLEVVLKAQRCGLLSTPLN